MRVRRRFALARAIASTNGGWPGRVSVLVRAEPPSGVLRQDGQPAKWVGRATKWGCVCQRWAAFASGVTVCQRLGWFANGGMGLPIVGLICQQYDGLPTFVPFRLSYPCSPALERWRTWIALANVLGRPRTPPDRWRISTALANRRDRWRASPRIGERTRTLANQIERWRTAPQDWQTDPMIGEPRPSHTTPHAQSSQSPHAQSSQSPPARTQHDGGPAWVGRAPVGVVSGQRWSIGT